MNSTGIIGTALAIVAVHSHNDEPLSDMNPILASGDKNFDNRLSVDEWIKILSSYDINNDGSFSKEEYDETEKLLDGTCINS